MNEFKVIVRKQIHSCFASWSHTDVFVKYELALPFAPFPGLELSDGDWNDVLIEVCWNIAGREFQCFTEPDKTLYDRYHEQMNKTDELALAQIVQGYLEQGWQIDPDWMAEPVPAPPADED